MRLSDSQSSGLPRSRENKAANEKQSREAAKQRFLGRAVDAASLVLPDLRVKHHKSFWAAETVGYRRGLPGDIRLSVYLPGECAVFFLEVEGWKR